MFLRRTVLLAAVWVLVLDVVLQELRFPLLIPGPLDASAHPATAIILLANPPSPSAAFATAAPVAAMAIDLDHVAVDHVAGWVPRRGPPRRRNTPAIYALFGDRAA